VFIVVYFVIDSSRKLLDIASYSASDTVQKSTATNTATVRNFEVMYNKFKAGGNYICVNTCKKDDDDDDRG
jgi:hypothetical protein